MKSRWRLELGIFEGLGGHAGSDALRQDCLDLFEVVFDEPVQGTVRVTQ